MHCRLRATARRASGATSRVSLAVFVREVAVAAHRDAEQHQVHLTIQPGDPALAVDVDPQLLASAAMNLLQNALKYTRAHGCVTLRTRCENGGCIFGIQLPLAAPLDAGP